MGAGIQARSFGRAGLGLEDLIDKLQGAKCIADLEARNDGTDTETRKRILEISERYGLASSEMSLVAVVERTEDLPGHTPKTSIVPVGMPHDTKIESYFGMQGGINAHVAKARRAPAIHFRPAGDEVIGEECRFSGITITVNPPRTPTVGDLLAIVRDAMKIVDDQTTIRAQTHETTRICELLTMLVVEGRLVETGAQKVGIRSLVYFLTSDKVNFNDPSRDDRKRWTEMRKQLLDAWPELTNPSAHESSSVVLADGRDHEMKPGIFLEEALSIFQAWAKGPGNVDHGHSWLISDLEWLRTRLSDPITIDQAVALSDVLRGRPEGLLYLWEWLLDSSVSWNVFFILNECYDPLFDPEEGVSRLDLFKFEEFENPQEART